MKNSLFLHNPYDMFYDVNEVKTTNLIR